MKENKRLKIQLLWIESKDLWIDVYWIYQPKNIEKARERIEGVRWGNPDTQFRIVEETTTIKYKEIK